MIKVQAAIVVGNWQVPDPLTRQSGVQTVDRVG